MRWLSSYSLLKVYHAPGTVSQVALVVNIPPINPGDIGVVGLIPGLGRPPGGGHGNPLQYFFPGEHHGEESGGLWMVHIVAKSWT